MKIWYSDMETGCDDEGAYAWSIATSTDTGDYFRCRNISEYFTMLIKFTPKEIYFHNLKFDGEFILNHLEYSKLWTSAYDEKKQKFEDVKYMKSFSYRYLISAEGVWYSITLKIKNNIVHIFDSLKLAPMPLKKAGEAFHTKHQKLDMDFEKIFPRGYMPTKQEENYILNDTLVLKEFMEEIRGRGLEKMTIGSCCLSFFKKNFGVQDFNEFFPNVYDIVIDGINVGEFTERCYHGAFVYVNKYKKGKIVKNGRTYDVNSLYPYAMHSKSGFLYPYGKPEYWIGEPKHERKNLIHFYHFRCRFYIKDGFLPFIHIRKNSLYNPNENLETSCIKVNGCYTRFYYDDKNECVKDTDVELYMNSYEFGLFQEHYKVVDLEMIDGLTFNASSGFFDDYINYWMEIKQDAQGAERQIAKLYLNNLYGKFATKPDSSFKVVNDSENGLKFKTIEEDEKTPGYMPVGACVTSFALITTVRQAQKVYFKGKPGFCYSDTDSIHCDGNFDEFFNIHESRLGYWDKELEWREAKFLRQKCYIEKDYKGQHHITCAGMPEHCKNLLRISLGEDIEMKKAGLTQQELNFIKKKRTLNNFDFGLEVYGKLRPKHMKGGVTLEKTTFRIRNR